MTDAIPSGVFRAYDIRGVADRDLTESVSQRIGKGIARLASTQIKKDKIILGLGRDSRYSSPRIFQQIAYGLTSKGMVVKDLGEVTTPMSYFAHYNLELDGVIQITASHNPKDDNGLKLMLNKNTLFGPEIQQIANFAAQELYDANAKTPELDSVAAELRKNYLQFLHGHFAFSKKYKVVVDCGNGMAGAIIRDALAPYSSSLEILYEKVDCTFPNHEADPTVAENIHELQQVVKKTGADFGFAFDGDADRLGVVARSGRILWGDEILMLLSELVLKTKKNTTIIGEVKCSEKLFKMIRDRGGEPLMYKTGHSLIKKKMKEVFAPIAGEMSGHLFFADRYFGFDDAVYACLRVMEVVDTLKIDPDQWIGEFPESIVTPELRVFCEEKDKARLVSQVKQYFAKKPEAHIFDIDGVRASFKDGSWVLVRASNTQAVLVVRIEAVSDSRLKELQLHVEDALGRSLPAYV